MNLYLANILFLIVGVIFVALSIFIEKKKAIYIMGDYDENKAYYEKKLLKWTKNSFLVAGIIIAISSVAGIWFKFINSAAIFGITICLLAVIIGIGFSKYEKN